MSSPHLNVKPPTNSIIHNGFVFNKFSSLFVNLQEPTTNDDYSSDSTLSNSKSNNQRSLTSTPMLTEPSSQTTTNASSSAQISSGVSNSTESVTPTSSLASMIKVGYASVWCARWKIGSKVSKIMLSFFLSSSIFRCCLPAQCQSGRWFTQYTKICDFTQLSGIAVKVTAAWRSQEAHYGTSK